MTSIQSILFATDFSETSNRAQGYAGAMAAAFGAKLLVVHAYEAPFMPVPDGLAYVPPVDFQGLRAELEQELAKTKAQVRELGGREIETLVVEGQPWREIVRTAAEWGCDVIVIGTHGRSGISQLLLGSVAEKVVRHAECPVLTVNAKGRGGPDEQAAPTRR
jgi:nucleotide-binding universal stress UspA family protein